jgi:CBS domain-containing protein
MKRVQDVMTEMVGCCTPDTSLQDAAKMMVDYDCGCIPVIEDPANRSLVGVVTDRDITLRTVAQGRDPLQMRVGEVMSSPVYSVSPETSLDECCRVMEDHQVRRVPVVNGGGCCGIVAQADIATKGGQRRAAKVVQEVSQTNGHEAEAEMAA